MFAQARGRALKMRYREGLRLSCCALVKSIGQAEDGETDNGDAPEEAANDHEGIAHPWPPALDERDRHVGFIGPGWNAQLHRTTYLRSKNEPR